MSQVSFALGTKGTRYHNRARSSALTQAEREILHQRYLEAAEFRAAEDNHNLAAALRLGAALKQLKNEG